MNRKRTFILMVTALMLFVVILLVHNSSIPPKKDGPIPPATGAKDGMIPRDESDSRSPSSWADHKILDPSGHTPGNQNEPQGSEVFPLPGHGQETPGFASKPPVSGPPPKQPKEEPIKPPFIPSPKQPEEEKPPKEPGDHAPGIQVEEVNRDRSYGPIIQGK